MGEGLGRDGGRERGSVREREEGEKRRVRAEREGEGARELLLFSSHRLYSMS